jgi:NAD(P)-dependent dehydrogenase (short-subunit alcohol dehydrogenase family)
MARRLEGRAALVISGARGIGEAIAAFRLAIADILAEEGAATAARFGGRFVRTDVASPADVQTSVDAVLAAHGRLDILVQNAGISLWTRIENISRKGGTRCLRST